MSRTSKSGNRPDEGRTPAATEAVAPDDPHGVARFWRTERRFGFWAKRENDRLGLEIVRRFPDFATFLEASLAYHRDRPGRQGILWRTDVEDIERAARWKWQDGVWARRNYWLFRVGFGAMAAVLLAKTVYEISLLPWAGGGTPSPPMIVFETDPGGLREDNLTRMTDCHEFEGTGNVRVIIEPGPPFRVTTDPPEDRSPRSACVAEGLRKHLPHWITDRVVFTRVFRPALPPPP